MKASSLFHRSGWIPLREYVEDIQTMQKFGPWKVPLGWNDHFQLHLLRLILRFSWFQTTLGIQHPYQWSPSYAIILTELAREHFFETISEPEALFQKMHTYRLVNRLPLKNGKRYTLYVRGTHSNPATALSKAVGELLERMVTCFQDQDGKIETATPGVLMKGLIPVYYPPLFHRFLPLQSKRRVIHQPTLNSSLEWVKGRNLITGSQVYIPRKLTAWLEPISNEILHDVTSNGCAGYFTRDGAILRGILEIAHRDGFLVHWLTMIAPSRIRLETLPEELIVFVDELKTKGISLTLLNVTSLNIPSVIAVAINEKALVPQLVVSGGAALNFKEAIKAAIEELTVVSWRLNKDSSLQNEDLSTQESSTSEFNASSRQEYWRGTSRLEKIRWFVSGPWINFNEICRQDLESTSNEQQKLDRCLDVLARQGNEYCPIVYFRNHTMLRKLDYFVAQVFIPKAFPFYLNESRGTFDSDRLNEFARIQGKQKWTLNPEPHMFG